MGKRGDSMKERRVYYRTTVELPAYLNIPQMEEISHQATVVNISAGGFCFYTQRSVPNGTVIELTIEVTKGKPMTISATTAWAKKIGDTGDYMIGVKIDETGGSDVEKFLTYYCKEITQFINDLQKIKRD